MKFIVSLTELARQSPQDYSLGSDLQRIDGVELVAVGFSGKTATIIASEETLGSVEKAVPYARVYPDSDMELL